MDCKKAINNAREIIGESRDNDYVISPQSHQTIYKDKSTELSEILGSSKLESIARRYEENDEIAMKAQQEFTKVFNRANRLVLMTAIVISAILAIGILAQETEQSHVNYILGGLGAVSILSGAVATKDLHTMKNGHLLENWMEKRANAETARLEYFENLVNETPQSQESGNTYGDLLKLEYFRRYQLSVQLVYYRERSKDHKEQSSRLLSFSSWAAAGTAIAAGTATFSFQGEIFTAVAAFGVIFSALSTYASLREGTYQYRRNSERYYRTADTLEKLYAQLDDVRQAVCKAGSKPLLEYIEVVHEQLSLEHRQWQKQLDASKGSYGRLQHTLDDVLSKAG